MHLDNNHTEIPGKVEFILAELLEKGSEGEEMWNRTERWSEMEQGTVAGDASLDGGEGAENSMGIVNLVISVTKKSRTRSDLSIAT